MNFEVFPNELLLDLFEYFNGIDLLHTFSGLNSRFNFLLYKQFRFYCFNFRELSKHTFDMICQRHLPFVIDRMIALSLSDDQFTPNEINLFLSNIPSFSQFTHLRSLSLSHLCSKQTIMKVVGELHHLVNLTHLYFNSCYIQYPDQTDFELISNTIWSLSNLSHCNFRIRTKSPQLFCIPSILFSSLEYLSICGVKFQLNMINRLFQYTPRLKRLGIHISSSSDDDYITSSFPTLIDLKIGICITSHPSKILSLLLDTPNLRRLNLTLMFYLIDGHQWEKIIRNYLPKLKTFRFTMESLFDVHRHPEEQIDKLINSFRSSFWTDEHRWFVRCLIQGNIIQLHTVSKTFYYSPGTLPDLFKSTYPQDNLQKLYHNITTIYDKTFFDQPAFSNIRLPNIDYLSMKFPINDQFWSIVPNLNRVKSLLIYSYTNSFHSQFQTLLNQLSNLHKLSISQDASFPFQMSLFQCTNPSIRHLYLNGCKHYLNEEECITLTHSPLGIQCQILDILIKNHKSIINFVKNMINLRALHVHCEDLFLTINDKNIQWLKDRLPSTCLISRHPHSFSHIQIWL